MEKRSEDLIYAIKRGFIIGNHSYSHRRFSKISLEEYYEEIKRCDEIIEELYKKSKKKRQAKLFRFPYGDKGGKIVQFTRFNRFFLLNYFFGKGKKEKIQEFLKKLGYSQPQFENINYHYFKKYGLDSDRDVFWTYDFEEYRLSFDEILKRMDDKNPRQGGSLINFDSSEILLIHDHENTKETFFRIIDRLIEKGIEFRVPKF